MLFGSIKNNKTYVAAASRTEELKVFGEYMQNLSQTSGSELFNDIHKPDFIELMQDDDLKGYSIAYVFEHKNDEQAEAFCIAFNISVVHKKELKDLHEEMLTVSDENIDPYLSEKADQRAIGEIYDIEQTDPWDVRTPEQILKAYEDSKTLTDMQRDGKLTGESFTSHKDKKNKKGVAITDITTSRDENGNTQIDSATYIKQGEHALKARDFADDELGGVIADFTGSDRQKRFSAIVPGIDAIADDAIMYIVESDIITRQMVFETKIQRHKNSGALIFYNDTNWAITHESRDAAKLQKFIELAGRKSTVFPVNKKGELNVTAKKEYQDFASSLASNLGNGEDIYFRIDVSKKFINAVYMLSAAMDILMKEDLLYEKIHSTGVSEKGGWIVSRRMLSLEQISSHLKETGMIVNSAYAVNDWGQRIVDDDEVKVIDANAPPEIQQPRPWNGRMEEFLALGDGDIEKSWKKVKGKELIFCALPLGPNEGTLVYITPAEYFAEHKEAWDGQIPLEHLISPNLKPVEDSVNTYRSGREELGISQELASKGLLEHLFFNLYINNIM